MKSLMLQGTVEGELVANLPYQCILNIKFFENLGIGSPRFWCSDPARRAAPHQDDARRSAGLDHNLGSSAYCACRRPHTHTHQLQHV